MVGTNVGGTNSGLDVGPAVAVAVELGIGVSVVVGEDGTGDGVAVTCGPHAMNDDPITRKTKVWKRFLILTHFLETMLATLLPIFYGQGAIVSK
jgi:hypothetical protein